MHQNSKIVGLLKFFNTLSDDLMAQFRMISQQIQTFSHIETYRDQSCNTDLTRGSWKTELVSALLAGLMGMNESSSISPVSIIFSCSSGR